MLRRVYAPYSAQQEMENFRRLAHSLNFSGNNFPGNRVQPRFPAMNIWTGEDGAIVEAKLPGINPEELDISVEGETVTIAGSHTPETLEDGEKYLRRERRYGKFSRSFELPFAIEADQVEATFKNGILHLSLPRAETDKPKKITVNVA